MLDWIYALFIAIAFATTILSVKMRDEDEYWNIMFIVVSIGLWFIVAVLGLGGVETAYVGYNSTLGNSSIYYGVYAPEPFIYLCYFFGMMGCLCIIYLVVTIFGYYYQKIDKENAEKEREMMAEE